jgi:GNAT superfamily N-acetyltransferase
MFKNHHYLSDSINKSSHFYIAELDHKPVACVSVLSMPCGTINGAFRESRIVVLPDYQGRGIGTRLSDAIAEIYISQGKRYFSRTAHPRMGYYREKSKLWEPTSKNKKLRTDITHENVFKGHYVDNVRICFSHEYIGNINIGLL